MIQQDTIKLLRECDAGIKMGLTSIDEVIVYVKDASFKEKLEMYKTDHEKLKDELQTFLKQYHDEGKEPNPMAKSMSWLKTNVKLAMDTSDQTIADLMTDGCNMGIKSLYRYLNQYPAANKKIQEIVKRLADLEENMAKDCRKFL